MGVSPIDFGFLYGGKRDVPTQNTGGIPRFMIQSRVRETYRRERATGSMVRTLSTKRCPSKISHIIVVLNV